MKLLITFLSISGIALVAGLYTQTPVSTLSFGTYDVFVDTSEVSDILAAKQSVQFVGDVMLARRVETYLDSYGSSYVYSQLPPLASTTFLVGNFEAAVPVDHVQTPELAFNFSVDQQHIRALQEYGFSHMSLANNHAYDSGFNGFTNTVSALETSGLIPLGSPDSLGTTSVSYIELEEAVIGLVAVYAMVAEPDMILLEETLLEMNTQSDLQVVYIHWGTEYKPTHSKFQQELAYRMVDMGADAIMGHHPHVVQDIEVYNNALIFYSLGNFIFDQFFSKEVQEGLAVELSYSEYGLQYKLTGVTSIGSQSVPRHMAQHEQGLFLKDLAKKSSQELREMITEGLIKMEEIE